MNKLHKNSDCELKQQKWKSGLQGAVKVAVCCLQTESPKTEHGYI